MPYIGQGLTEGRRRLHNFVATSNQTTFTATYDVGYIDVYQNGILLTSTDYTATNGTTVVLAVGASSGDEITIIAHQIFSVTDTVSAITGGAFGGNVDVTGNITTTGSLRGPSSFTIDPATHGDNTGTVVIAGDLTVNGTTTTINSTTLDIDDKNITLASGSANSSVANGAGFTVDLGSDGTATINYDNTNDEWDFNKPIDVASITVNTLNGGANNFDIKQTTADGSDNKRTRIGGGGDVINTRGAFIELHGNEHTSTGKAIINAGNVTGGEISLRTAGSQKAVITKDGNVGINADVPGADYGSDIVLEIKGATSPGLVINDTGQASKYGIHADSNDLKITYGTGTLATFQNDGNVGIGTSSPGAKLDVRGEIRLDSGGSTSRSIYFRNQDSSSTGGGQLRSDQYLSLHAGNGAGSPTQYVTIKPGGNVGIGTTNPSALQQNYIDSGSANLALRLTQNNSGQGIWMEFQPGNNTDDWQVGANNAGFAIYNATDNRYDMVIKNDGNVGIGTHTPVSPLHVQADGIAIRVDGTANTTKTLFFRNTTTSNPAQIFTDGSLRLRTEDANTAIIFNTNSSGTNNEAMRITSGGNVGIGTENPAFKLQVYGTGNTAQVRIKGSNNSQYDFYAYSDNNFYINNPNGTILGLLENKDAYFGKNLGIGDSVLSTYHTSYPALELGSSASVQGYTGNNGVWLQSNLFMNTNGQWTSKSNDYSAMLELYDGNFHFYNSDSGTGTRPLSTPMVIKQNGRVGMGQPNPDAELHIGGSRPHIDVEDTVAGTRAKFGAGYANAYIATTSSGGDIFFKNGVGGSDFPHSSGTNLAIILANGGIKTYGNTFHIHAGQGTLGHANEFQFLTTEVATGTSGNWYDVCYVSHSPNLRFHGSSVQDNNQVYYGGARFIGALMGTYGNVACYQEQKRVSAMNGGGVSDIDYRYLNSGASSGSYRLQVKLNFSSGSHRVYTCVYGNATAELQKDGY